MYHAKHRRQREMTRSAAAGRTVAVGVAAAGIATAALATAPGAEARAAGVWDRVASCESGGNWHINTGNGFYGGLQFTYQTWQGLGGGKYASRADFASRVQQIEVARRVLAAQGAGAWPVCGYRAGLNAQNGGATRAALPAVAGTHATQSARQAPARHRTAAQIRMARRHAYYRSHHRTAAGHYRVRSGDTLSVIAARLHVSGGWHTLYAMNRHVLYNPNVVQIGQVLRVPR